MYNSMENVLRIKVYLLCGGGRLVVKRVLSGVVCVVQKRVYGVVE